MPEKLTNLVRLFFRNASIATLHSSRTCLCWISVRATRAGMRKCYDSSDSDGGAYHNTYPDKNGTCLALLSRCNHCSSWPGGGNTGGLLKRSRGRADRL